MKNLIDNFKHKNKEFQLNIYVINEKNIQEKCQKIIILIIKLNKKFKIINFNSTKKRDYLMKVKIN